MNQEDVYAAAVAVFIIALWVLFWVHYPIPTQLVAIAGIIGTGIGAGVDRFMPERDFWDS